MFLVYWQKLTTFGAEYCLPLIFHPKLTHSAAQSLCGSWATCFHIIVLDRNSPQKTSLATLNHKVNINNNNNNPYHNHSRHSHYTLLISKSLGKYLGQKN